MSSTSKTDYEKSPAKGNNYDDKADSPLDDPLGDGIEHDAEPSAKKGIATDHEDDLNPWETDCCRGDDIQNGEMILKYHRRQGQEENEDLEPALQFFKMSSSKCYELKYLLEEDSKEGDEEGDLDWAESRVHGLMVVMNIAAGEDGRAVVPLPEDSSQLLCLLCSLLS